MPQKMLKPRVWVIVVAVLLMCTCVGSPLGILVAVLEGLRLRKIGKARIEAAIRSLTRGYPTPPVLPRPGPTENPANVQVAPFIREESLRAALTPRSLASPSAHFFKAGTASRASGPMPPSIVAAFSRTCQS